MKLHEWHEQIQAHPSLGWTGSIGSVSIAVITSVYDKVIQNVDLATRIFALSAAIFGACAGLYTFLIQRRNYKRGSMLQD